MSEVEAIEAATRAALVAEEHEIDGWWLRSNPSLPNRRPNSATTPPHGPIDLTTIGEIIGWFVVRGRPPIVRVLSTADPRLDEHLDEHGWTSEAPTRVMVSHSTGPAPSDARVLEGTAGPAPEFVELRTQVGTGATAAQLVHDIGRGSDAAYAVAPLAAPPVAVGRATLDGALVGLYDVVTLPEHRRRGWATEVVKALMTWGQGRGATAVFLQVETDNAPAIALYEGLGFLTLYTYRYRRPPV